MDCGERWGNVSVEGGGAKLDALVSGPQLVRGLYTWREGGAGTTKRERAEPHRPAFLCGSFVYSLFCLLYAHPRITRTIRHTRGYSIPGSPHPSALSLSAHSVPFTASRTEYDGISRNFFARLLAADALRRGESVPERAWTVHLCLAEPRRSTLVLVRDHDRRLLARPLCTTA